MAGYYIEPAIAPTQIWLVGARAEQSRQIFLYPFVAAPNAVFGLTPSSPVMAAQFNTRTPEERSRLPGHVLGSRQSVFGQ